ncbi:MAG: hypothetical protein V1907_01140 [Candidatus Kerfeldbacteria bacterium]
MSALAPHTITRLDFKHEGEDENGHLIPKLTDQDCQPVYRDERWVSKQDALRIARDLGTRRPAVREDLGNALDGGHKGR